VKVTIYGCSDDLVEVEGDLTDEFSGDDVLLMFGDDTHIRARYDKDGIWRLACGKEGTAKCVGAFVATDPESDYSDRMTLEGDLISVEKWMDRGELIDALTDWNWAGHSEPDLRQIVALAKSMTAAKGRW
jgi:hypothetical protein